MAVSYTSRTPQPEPHRITVFGGTRGVGRQVVEQALEAGHQVTVLARDPSRMDRKHPHLEVVAGDALNELDVARAIRGSDAVFVALGAPALSTSRIRSEGTRTIVHAMESLGVRRLICLSLLGAGESRKRLPFFYRWVIFPTYLRRPVADHERQERVVAASSLDWTVVRPPNLTDAPRTGDYEEGFDGLDGLSLSISRADVADLMLRELESPRYLRRTVGIAYRK